MAGGSRPYSYRFVENNLQRSRPFRTRTRTACITCKIRKVRCDEQKPSCNRCVSMGRKCDGYNSDAGVLLGTHHCPMSSSSTDLHTRLDMLAMPRQLKVALPRHNEQEIQSYRFFLDVTAPALASVFDIEFWLTHIPRACHLDAAIWHAVVSLGAVHENYISSVRDATYNSAKVTFALQQSNAAISYLVRRSTPRTVHEERWRALTVSIVFTYLCSIQGLYLQSSIHLTAAKNLIKELQGIKEHDLDSKTAQSTSAIVVSIPGAQSGSVPVPYESLLSIVANLEIGAQALQSSGANDGSASLRDTNAYTTWRYYSAPSLGDSSYVCPHGKCIRSRATAANLNYAGRAIKSLLNGLMALSQRNAVDVARLVLRDERGLLATLVHRQKPYARAFRELGIAIDMFIKDTAAQCLCFHLASTYSSTSWSQKKAIDVLRLYHATCHPLFLEKPTDVNPSLETYHPLLPGNQGLGSSGPMSSENNNTLLDPREALAMHFARTLDLAERVLQDDTLQARLDDTLDFTPALPTTMPLLIISQISGVSTELRRRVTNLLRRYPQREVLWDSTFAAVLAELIMEQEAGGKHLCVTQRNRTSEPLHINEEMEEPTPKTPLTNKVYGIGVTYTETNSAVVMIQTWEDWIATNSGRERLLTW